MDLFCFCRCDTTDLCFDYGCESTCATRRTLRRSSRSTSTSRIAGTIQITCYLHGNVVVLDISTLSVGEVTERLLASEDPSDLAPTMVDGKLYLTEEQWLQQYNHGRSSGGHRGYGRRRSGRGRGHNDRNRERHMTHQAGRPAGMVMDASMPQLWQT